MLFEVRDPFRPSSTPGSAGNSWYDGLPRSRHDPQRGRHASHYKMAVPLGSPDDRERLFADIEEVKRSFRLLTATASLSGALSRYADVHHAFVFEYQ